MVRSGPLLPARVPTVGRDIAQRDARIGTYPEPLHGSRKSFSGLRKRSQKYLARKLRSGGMNADNTDMERAGTCRSITFASGDRSWRSG